MDTVYIDKYRYWIQEQKEVPVGMSVYTGPFRALFLAQFGLRFTCIRLGVVPLCTL
jgi:hypothetical protein